MLTGPPDLLHGILAGALALAGIAVLWCVRKAGRMEERRAVMAQAQALERKVEALRRVEERYRSFIDQAPVGIFRTRPSGRFISANGKMAKLLGYSGIDELLEQVTDIGRQHYVDSRLRAEMYRRVMAEGSVRNHEVQLRRVDGQMVWLSLSLRAVCDDTGAIDHLEGFAVNVTDRKQAQEALAGSERMHRHMLRWMRDILYRLDAGGRIVFINHAATLYGYRVEELLGRDILDLAAPGDRERLRHNLAERRTGERRTSGMEFALEPGPESGSDASRTVMLLEAEGVYETDENGALKFLGTIGMARDISRRKLAEERLTQSLEAKELLLQELRHRVKNNLQVIQSLISLTASRTVNPEAGRVCREIFGYVRCMAAMHALLSRAPAGSHVSLADMVRDIYAAVSGLFPDAKVETAFELEDVPLHLDMALPCGMLLNELFTNAFKHAFPDGRAGQVSVDLTRLPDGRALLTVADNGVGFGGDSLQCGLGVGMGLIRSLTAQLGAKLDMGGDNGAAACLVFDPSGRRDRLHEVLGREG